MSTDQCRNVRPLLGLYALGRLDDAQDVAVQAHLDGCPDCRSDVDGLRQVADALNQADPERVSESPVAPPASLRTAIFDEIAKERPRPRRRLVRGPRRWPAKVVLPVAAALAVCLGGGALAVHEAAPPGSPVAFTTRPSGVQASASVEGRGWGTMVHLDLAGLPRGHRYMVWLEKPDGHRMPAGSFIAGGDRTMSMELAVGMPMPEATALGISTPDDRKPLLRAPLHA